MNRRAATEFKCWKRKGKWTIFSTLTSFTSSATLMSDHDLNLTQRATSYLHPPSPHNHHHHHLHHQHIRKVLACIIIDAFAVPLILVEELFLQQATTFGFMNLLCLPLFLLILSFFRNDNYTNCTYKSKLMFKHTFLTRHTH